VQIASQIVKMLTEYGECSPKPIIDNVMTFLGELVTSGEIAQPFYFEWGRVGQSSGIF